MVSTGATASTLNSTQTIRAIFQNADIKFAKELSEPNTAVFYSDGTYFRYIGKEGETVSYDHAPKMRPCFSTRSSQLVAIHSNFTFSQDVVVS